MKQCCDLFARTRNTQLLSLYNEKTRLLLTYRFLERLKQIQAEYSRGSVLK